MSKCDSLESLAKYTDSHRQYADVREAINTASTESEVDQVLELVVRSVTVTFGHYSAIASELRRILILHLNTESRLTFSSNTQERLLRLLDLLEKQSMNFRIRPLSTVVEQSWQNWVRNTDDTSPHGAMTIPWSALSREDKAARALTLIAMCIVICSLMLNAPDRYSAMRLNYGLEVDRALFQQLCTFGGVCVAGFVLQYMFTWLTVRRSKLRLNLNELRRLRIGWLVSMGIYHLGVYMVIFIAIWKWLIG